MESIFFALISLAGLFIVWKLFSFVTRLIVILIGVSFLISIPSYLVYKGGSDLNSEPYWNEGNSEIIEELIQSNKIILLVLPQEEGHFCLSSSFNNLFAFQRTEFMDFVIKNDIILTGVEYWKEREDLDNLFEQFDQRDGPINMIFSTKHPQGRVLRKYLTTSYLIAELKEEIEAIDQKKDSIP